jgi:hypothetical protein
MSINTSLAHHFGRTTSQLSTIRSHIYLNHSTIDYDRSDYWTKTVKQLRTLLKKRRIQHKHLKVKAQ